MTFFKYASKSTSSNRRRRSQVVPFTANQSDGLKESTGSKCNHRCQNSNETSHTFDTLVAKSLSVARQLDMGGLKRDLKMLKLDLRLLEKTRERLDARYRFDVHVVDTKLKDLQEPLNHRRDRKRSLRGILRLAKNQPPRDTSITQISVEEQPRSYQEDENEALQRKEMLNRVVYERECAKMEAEKRRLTSLIQTTNIKLSKMTVSKLMLQLN